MAQHMIMVGPKDHIVAVPPMNGETTFLRILYGQGANQIHIDRSVAKRLRDSISQALAELDEIEHAGHTQAQREQAALDIIASHHMQDLPVRTQKTIHNKLTGQN